MERNGFMAGETMQIEVTLISLGENNRGQLGPIPFGLSPEQTAAIENDVSSPEYQAETTKIWGCVDGRLSEDEELAFEDGNDEKVMCQTGGGWVVTCTSARMMEPNQTKPLSELTAEETQDAVADDIEVTLHGDEDNDTDGCYANREQKAVLEFNAANMDIIAPLTWAVSTGLNLDEFIEEKDVTDSIVNGKENADNLILWDADTGAIKKIIVDNGGKYIVLKGKHKEAITLVKTTKGGFKKTRFMRDHDDISAFVATMGEYKKAVFEAAAKRNTSKRDAALKVMRAAAYNIGLAKQLQSEDHRTALEKAV